MLQGPDKCGCTIFGLSNRAPVETIYMYSACPTGRFCPCPKVPHLSDSEFSIFRAETHATRVVFGKFQIFRRELRQTIVDRFSGRVENLPFGQTVEHLFFSQLISMPVRPSTWKYSVIGPHFVWCCGGAQSKGPNLLGLGPHFPRLEFLHTIFVNYSRVNHFV